MTLPYDTDLCGEDFRALSVAELDGPAWEAWLEQIRGTEDGEHDEDLPYLFDELDALQIALTPGRWTELCEQYDICPEHVCDMQICLDDLPGEPCAHAQQIADAQVRAVEIQLARARAQSALARERLGL